MEKKTPIQFCGSTRLVEDWFSHEKLLRWWRTPSSCDATGKEEEHIDTTTLYMQRKMTNAMRMKEQIELSGLEIMSSCRHRRHHRRHRRSCNGIPPTNGLPFWVEDGNTRLA